MASVMLPLLALPAAAPSILCFPLTTAMNFLGTDPANSISAGLVVPAGTTSSLVSSLKGPLPSLTSTPLSSIVTLTPPPATGSRETIAGFLEVPPDPSRCIDQSTRMSKGEVFETQNFLFCVAEHTHRSPQFTFRDRLSTTWLVE